MLWIACQLRRSTSTDGRVMKSRKLSSVPRILCVCGCARHEFHHELLGDALVNSVEAAASGRWCVMILVEMRHCHCPQKKGVLDVFVVSYTRVLNLKSIVYHDRQIDIDSFGNASRP